MQDQETFNHYLQGPKWYTAAAQSYFHNGAATGDSK
jgi:hypothetical protein